MRTQEVVALRGQLQAYMDSCPMVDPATTTIHELLSHLNAVVLQGDTSNADLYYALVALQAAYPDLADQWKSVYFLMTELKKMGHADLAQKVLIYVDTGDYGHSLLIPSLMNLLAPADKRQEVAH
jgi:hypothetical protein